MSISAGKISNLAWFFTGFLPPIKVINCWKVSLCFICFVHTVINDSSSPAVSLPVFNYQVHISIFYCTHDHYICIGCKLQFSSVVQRSCNLKKKSKEYSRMHACIFQSKLGHASTVRISLSHLLSSDLQCCFNDDLSPHKSAAFLQCAILCCEYSNDSRALLYRQLSAVQPKKWTGAALQQCCVVRTGWQSSHHTTPWNLLHFSWSQEPQLRMSIGIKNCLPQFKKSALFTFLGGGGT